MENLLLFVFGGVFVLALARRRASPAAVALPIEGSDKGSMAILFFVMLAMMWVMMQVAK